MERQVKLRRITNDDYTPLKQLLQNEELMTIGWGKTYSDQEVRAWLDKILQQYQEVGYSYFAVENQQEIFIGIAGLIDTVIRESYTEVAYIIDQPFHGQGYASQVIQQLITLGFETYGKKQLIAQVVPENQISKHLIEKNDFTYAFTYGREQNGTIKEHLVYRKDSYMGQKDGRILRNKKQFGYIDS